MPKKSSGKRTVKLSRTKKGNLRMIITRLTLFFGVLAIFFFGTKTFINQRYSEPLCANSKTCISDLTEHIDTNATAIFEGKKIKAPNISKDLAIAPVLGINTGPGEKHIYVDLATQTLYAYQGTNLILKTLVSTGKWNKTPVGNFHIWEKLAATRMAGGEGADAYDLPNVPWVMYFYRDFGLHGAYWHDNFGHTMSHGCVNMRPIDAKALFTWANGPEKGKQGTTVSVCNRITKDRQCIQNNPVKQL